MCMCMLVSLCVSSNAMQPEASTSTDRALTEEDYEQLGLHYVFDLPTWGEAGEEQTRCVLRRGGTTKKKRQQSKDSG